MANPDFRSESGADQGGTASATVTFTGLTWQANDIICVLVATDGYVPTLSTANGFVLAQDPQGNTASVTTNSGTPSTADCGLFLFWKRAVGSTTAADPEPVIAAPTGGGTCWCLETNSYLGARTSGTPWHLITTAIVGTATATVAPPSVTPTLASVLVMPCAASANDDQAFNAWTLTGAASPTGQIDSAWHNGSGSACAFTAGRGGYASVGGARSGSTTFSATTKQAQFTLVMASLAEASAPDDDARQPRAAPLAPPVALIWPIAGDEIPGSATAIMDDDVAPPQLRSALPPQVLTWAPADDDIPGTAPTGFGDEDPRLSTAIATPPVAAIQRVVDDDFPGTAPPLVDEDGPLPRWMTPPPVVALVPPPGDEIAGIAQPTGIDEDATLLSPMPRAPVTPLPLPVSADELVAPATSGIGGAGDMQRSLSQPAQTGTLTTVAPVPAWTTSLAVVVDPSQGGTNRVTNGGNLYQCRTGGTTSSSGGGPTGTGTSISDGSAVWYFVGAAQSTNTAAGSQVLCSVMRGTQSQAASIPPSDNDGGGTYTLITNNAYTNFTASFAGVWRRPTASNAKTSFTTSAVWGGSGGAGDEMSICWVEIQGVSVGAPHAFSQVERLSATGGLGGTVTAASITTTVPCVIVSFWFGNGNVQSTGVPDAATPAGGLTLIAGCTGPLSLTPNGYIQHMVAWRKQATPGTFAEVWTASPVDEGAQLVTVAFQDLSSTVLPVEDDQPPPVPRLFSVPLPFQLAPAPDELAITTVEDEAAVRPAAAPSLGAPMIAPLAVDELAASTLLGDDEQLQPPLVPVSPPSLVIVRSDDEVPVAVAASALDEDAPPRMAAAPLAPLVGVAPQADELAVAAAPAVVDEDGALMPAPPGPPASPTITLQGDELAQVVVASMIDEDGTLPAPPITQPVWSMSFPVQVDEFVLAAAAMLDEDSQIALLLANAVQAPVLLPQSDETLPGALDDATSTPPAPSMPASPLLWLVPEDEFQGVFVPPPSAMIDEDGPQPQLPWQAPAPGLYLMSIDELAIALSIPSLTKHVLVVGGPGPVAIVVNNAPTVIIVEEPNV